MQRFFLVALATLAACSFTLAQVTVRYDRTAGAGSTPAGYNNVLDDCTLAVAGGTRVRDFTFSWNLTGGAGQHLRITVAFYDTMNLGAVGLTGVNSNLITAISFDRFNQGAGTRITSAGLGNVDFIIPDNTVGIQITAAELTAGGALTGNMAPNFRARMVTATGGSDIGTNDGTKFWRSILPITSFTGGDLVNTPPNGLYFSISGEIPPPAITGRLDFGQGSYFSGAIPTTALIDFKDANYTVLASVSTPLGANGEFDVLKPSAVTVPFRISYRNKPYLRRTVPAGLNDPLIPISGPYNVGDMTLVPGDVDGDNEITNSDYALWASVNGLSFGHPNFNADADLDGDNEITNADYALWASGNGMQGDD